MQRIWLCLLLPLIIALTAVPTSANPTVHWRVENPFRLFSDPADTNRHRATYEALPPEQRGQPILNAERYLASRHPDGWAAALSGKICWDAKTNRYRCPRELENYVQPRHHRVEVWLEDLGELAGEACLWLTAPRARDRERGVAVSHPCNEILVLEIPYPRGADITVELDGRSIARDRIVVQDILIVGLGDSFGSGEGNPDVPVRFSRQRSADYGLSSEGVNLTGYPARVGDWQEIGDEIFIKNNARWLDQACHRSLYSHQLRVALQLGIEDPHRAVTFLGFACSGAEITAGLFLRYKGNEWVEHPPDVSQISAVARAQCGERDVPLKDYPEAYHIGGKITDLKGSVRLHKCEREFARKIDLILVSIGGNDIGFARLVANAVLRDQSTLKQLGGWFGQVYDKEDIEEPLKNLDYRYKALHRAFHNILHVPWNESDRIILTAYPPLALQQDGRSLCPDGGIGMDVLPAFSLNSSRAKDGEDVSQKLFKVMEGHAKNRGWTFAKHHWKVFLSHSLCAGFQIANPTPANDLRLPRWHSDGWHPYNPADYRPYMQRQRWFRTPNDAFMTANFHVTGSLLDSVLRADGLRWMQLLLAATYSGAFHPTAEGQAAIADSVATKARYLLERYSGNNLKK